MHMRGYKQITPRKWSAMTTGGHGGPCCCALLLEACMQVVSRLDGDRHGKEGAQLCNRIPHALSRLPGFEHFDHLVVHHLARLVAHL